MNANETSIAVLAPHEDALNRLDSDTVMKLYSPNGVFLPQYFPSSVGAASVCNNMSAPVELDQWMATCVQTSPGGSGPDWKKFHCATQKSHRSARMAVLPTSRARRATSMVRLALMNWRRAQRTMCLIAITTIVHPAQSQQAKPAEPKVAAANQAVLSQLPFSDRQDFEDAKRGFIATTPDAANPDRWAFLEHEAPPTVNPSLWRQAQLNVPSGLFKVAEGVYQVRGFSQANMTIVEGTTGLILIDTLTSPGAAREALGLYFAHRPRKPVVAVIYSHSHGDHYGGASGVVSLADAAARKTKVIAPAGFMEAVDGEAVVGGNAKARRGQYQFGISLPVGERANIDEGIGKNDSRGGGGVGVGVGVGVAPIIPPNDTIQQPMETRTIDGVDLVFELALDSEAPSEMLIYLPQSHVLDVAEDATHTLHNLLPFRGTGVRDANRWSQYLNVALEQFGADAQVMIAQHQWPVWGNERVRAHLADQRDLYKYIHDQTIRLMNQGLGPTEIAEALTMPPGLEKDWSTHGYYGTIAHN
jgi:alkyl sulfatase BDS1-like metallo-beta-lactamase superfamily hydrolase